MGGDWDSGASCEPHSDDHVCGLINPRVPSTARAYDYLLGGKDNYAADRELAERVAQSDPAIALIAQHNRAFLRRAVMRMAAAGATQFLDLGTGLPTQENVHEVAQRVVPDARVVYVDNDPAVLVHARALLVTDDRTIVVDADLRDAAALMRRPEIWDHLDMDSPVGVLAVAVLHFLNDLDVYSLLKEIHGVVAPSSMLALSHAAPASTDRAADVAITYRDTGAAPEATLRTAEDVQELINGRWEFTDPGLIRIDEWRPDPYQEEISAASVDDLWVVGGVAEWH